MQTSGEVADTTEASNGSGPVPAAAAAGTESEREAASVAQVEAPSAAEPCVRVRRDTEPVTTSLSTEEPSHTSDNAQVQMHTLSANATFAITNCVQNYFLYRVTSPSCSDVLLRNY